LKSPKARLKSRPLIGVTVDWDDEGRVVEKRVRTEGAYFLYSAYTTAITDAGGVPLLIPHFSDSELIESVLDGVDGLLVTGGDFDIDPITYGEEPEEDIGRVVEARTKSETELILRAIKAEMPILAICGGEQLLNTVCGGTLVQDIARAIPKALRHEQVIPKNQPSHKVKVSPSSHLVKIVNSDQLEINSTHHQAVKDVGKGIRINATAADGVIEGIELVEHPFAIGVQWHPELLAHRDERQASIFQAFVSACIS